MRKITSESAYAFEHKQWYKNSNTKVFIDSAGSWLELHGSRIAHIDEQGQLEITNAGWPTATTKERLNGLVGVHIVQKAGKWYLNGNKWDGEWITVIKE